MEARPTAWWDAVANLYSKRTTKGRKKLSLQKHKQTLKRKYDMWKSVCEN